jgi:hypothetical protein
MTGPHLFQKLRTAQPRHSVISDDQVEMSFAQLSEGREPVARRDDMVSLPSQGGNHEKPGVMIVVNDQYQFVRSLHPGLLR